MTKADIVSEISKATGIDRLLFLKQLKSLWKQLRTACQTAKMYISVVSVALS